MNFEEALRNELINIKELNNKVYPLYAPKDVKAPFVVYKKDEINYTMILEGRTNISEAVYGIVVIAATYAELQNITDKVIDKLFSFQSKVIGIDGPKIQMIKVKHLGDSYEYETDLLRANIQIQVSF